MGVVLRTEVCLQGGCTQGGQQCLEEAPPGSLLLCPGSCTPFIRHGLRTKTQGFHHHHHHPAFVPTQDSALTPHMCPLLHSWLSLRSSPRTEVATVAGRLLAPRAGLLSTASSRRRTSSCSSRLHLWLKTEASLEAQAARGRKDPLRRLSLCLPHSCMEAQGSPGAALPPFPLSAVSLLQVSRQAGFISLRILLSFTQPFRK